MLMMLGCRLGLIIVPWITWFFIMWLFDKELTNAIAASQEGKTNFTSIVFVLMFIILIAWTIVMLGHIMHLLWLWAW